MDSTPTPGFHSNVDLAEVATAGVQFNLAVRDELAAAALQPVALAAWGLAEEPQAVSQLVEAVHAAEGALAMARGMSGERQFLADVLAYLDDPRSPGGTEAEDRLPPAAPEFPVPVRVDFDEAQRLGATAGAYLRAAAALGEASVLMRVAGSAIELDACGAEAIIDDAVARASEVLEEAAGAYAHAVDLLSRSQAAKHPDLDLHLQELRVGVRALTIEAVRLSPTEDDAYHRGDDPDVYDPDGQDSDEVTDHELLEFFVDRAETFGAKARFMTACAERIAAHAWGLAAE